MSFDVLLYEVVLPRLLIWLALSFASLGVTYLVRGRRFGVALFRVAAVLACVQAALVACSIWIDATGGTVGPFSASFRLFFLMLPLAVVQLTAVPLAGGAFLASLVTPER